LTLDQIPLLPSFSATLLPNTNYTLIIASSQGSAPQFLLLIDSAPSQSQTTPKQTWVRLVNLIQSQSASLVSSDASCTSGSSDALVPSTSFLQASAYTLLSSNVSLSNLRVCINGAPVQILLAPIFQGSSTIYSIFVFNWNNSTRYQFEQGILAHGMLAMVGQVSQSSGQNSTQNPVLYAPFIADDEPTLVNNSRLRAIHGAPGFPAVNVLVDGELWFTLTYANVTSYKPTIRGVHNITITLASALTADQLQGMNLTVQFPYSFLAFLAWDSYYTLAVLPTGLQLMLNQNQNGQSGGQGSLDLANAFRADVGSGFLGPLQRIFLDNIPTSLLRPDVAFVQVIHLAVKTGPVNITFGQQHVIVVPLEDTPYRPVQPGNSSSVRITTLSPTAQPLQSVPRNLEPNTLYTLFILDLQGGGALAFFQTDRSVRVFCSVINIDESPTQG